MINKIGDKGSLLFPTYNWDFCGGKVFDYQNSKSQTGSLSNIALQRNDFTRTKHPIYSHVVWGSDKNLLFNKNNVDAFSSDSVFGYLHKNRAKQLFISANESFWFLKAYTSIHYIEQKVGVEYRYIKKFKGTYINEMGIKRKKTFSMFVRDTEFKDEFGNMLTSQVDPEITNLLIKKGFYYKKFINDIYFVIIDMYGLGEILERSIRSNNNYIKFVPIK